MAALNPPTNLAIDEIYSNAFFLSWTDATTPINPDYYEIDRSDDAGSSWELIATVDQGVQEYLDTGVSADTTYDYRIRSIDESGTYDPSAYHPTPPTRVYDDTLEEDIEYIHLGDVSEMMSMDRNALDLVQIDLGRYKRQPLVYPVVYDDLQVSIATVKLPASNDPDWVDYAFGVGGGVTFPVLGFALNEYMYFYVQSTHKMKISTIVDNHIHWTIPSNDSGKYINFRLDVIAAAINTSFAVPTGSPFTAERVLDGTEANVHKLMEIADIPAVNTTVSTAYICKLTRIAAVSGTDYGSDVYIIFTDCHVQNNTLGSNAEDAK